MPQAYCLKCKKKQEMDKVEETTMKGRGGTQKKALTGVCSKCGTKMFKVLRKAETAGKGRVPAVEQDSLPGKEIKEEISKPMKIKDIIEQAKKSLADLTGFKTPRGIGAKKIGNEWIVRVEITEKTSIPEAMDVLGIYDVHLDDEGNVLSYARKGLKKRGDTDAEIEEEKEA